MKTAIVPKPSCVCSEARKANVEREGRDWTQYGLHHAFPACRLAVNDHWQARALNAETEIARLVGGC